MMENYFKVVVYVPVSHAEAVREALARSGAGRLGNYDACTFSVKGIGRFRPLKGATPTLGSVGTVEEVEEERIETLCEAALAKKVVEAVKAVHPYEEPAIDVMPLKMPF